MSTIKFRFIPACAGNIPANFSGPIAWPVHPRVCGEHSLKEITPFHFTGSSPRVRGTLANAALVKPFKRFIPACAGNMPAAGSTSDVKPVHPRVCGEHAGCRQHIGRQAGSSPRVRGTFAGSGHLNVNLRFIPACAGNITRKPCSSLHWSVHPRVCGEHWGGGIEHLVKIGSSPRVRGTSGRCCWSAWVNRFIPACAGNMRLSTSSSPLLTVHPRVCGEHSPSNSPIDNRPGSSPRVRGT